MFPDMERRMESNMRGTMMTIVITTAIKMAALVCCVLFIMTEVADRRVTKIAMIDQICEKDEQACVIALSDYVKGAW